MGIMKKENDMVDTNKLLGKMKEQGVSVPELAREIGVAPSTIYRILNNDGKSFTVSQVEVIKNMLHLNSRTVVAIFLA